jgi:prevent-host-death family protein
METVNVAEAKSRFSELISRAAAGERFVIQRRERSVAILISPEELERLERTVQAARRLALALGQDAALVEQIERHQTHPAMAGFGLWRDDPSLETLVDELYKARQSAPTRPGADL